jgi:hypothetical protein
MLTGLCLLSVLRAAVRSGTYAEHKPDDQPESGHNRQEKMQNVVRCVPHGEHLSVRPTPSLRVFRPHEENKQQGIVISNRYE